MAAMVSRWREGLTTTSQKAFGRLVSILGASEMDDTTRDKLKAAFTKAEIRMSACHDVLRSLQKAARDQGVHRGRDLRSAMLMELRGKLAAGPVLRRTGGPFMEVVVGVDGSGKATTIYRLTHDFGRLAGPSCSVLQKPTLPPPSIN